MSTPGQGQDFSFVEIDPTTVQPFKSAAPAASAAPPPAQDFSNIEIDPTTVQPIGQPATAPEPSIWDKTVNAMGRFNHGLKTEANTIVNTLYNGVTQIPPELYHGATDPPKNPQEQVIHQHSGQLGLASLRAANNLVEAGKQLAESTSKNYAEAQQKYKQALDDFHKGDYRSAAASFGSNVGAAIGVVPAIGPTIGDPIKNVSEATRPGGDLAGELGKVTADASAALAPEAAGVAFGEVPEVMGKAGKAVGKVRDAVKASSEKSASAKLARVSNEDFIKANKDFKNAIPSTKTAPYSDNDLIVSRNYTEPHHTEVEPIRSVQHVVDAHDYAIEGVENKISEKGLKVIPDEKIGVNILDHVKAGLSEGPSEAGFVERGLKELEGYDLENPTTTEADALRRRLNTKNRAILKKNKYDVAAARVDDPGFAARELAADALRDGEYNTFEAHGIDGVRELRQEEGSLIKVRNAAQNQIANGDKIVKGSSGASKLQRVAGKTVKGLSAAAGTGIGGVTMGVPGAIAGQALGSEIGEAASAALAPEDLSRDALVERSFTKKAATGNPGDISVNLKAREPQPTPSGTQGKLPEVMPSGTPEQLSLNAQDTPYPAPAGAMQSVHNQLLFLQKEIRPLQAIINDPLATQAAKVEAANKLGKLPLSDLQNVSAESTPSGGRPESLSPNKRIEPEEDGIVEQKPEPKPKPKNNGSGESAASQEAINRSASEKAKGIQRIRIDTRSGHETLLHGADAIDAKAGHYDRIVLRQPGAADIILDEGKHSRPMPRRVPPPHTGHRGFAVLSGDAD